MAGQDEIVCSLVKALGKGSVDAFDRIYKMFHRKVERVAAAIVGSDNRSVIQDISQNIFLKVWEKRTLVSGKVKDFDSYLFRMTKNESLNYLERTLFNHMSLSPEMPLLSSEETGHMVEAEETRAILEEALRTMPPQRRKAFLMSRGKGMSYKEIAEEMGIAPKTVENHISQSLKDLKKTLS